MKRKRRNPITRERARTEATIVKAIMHNQQCYIYLHIADGRMDHMDVLDKLFEDIGKAQHRITFPTVEIPDITCIRSEWEKCIAPDDAIIVDGELPADVSVLKPPTQVEHTESQIWHFYGAMWLVNIEACFCEYDATKRQGGMILFINGENISKFIKKYPQLKNNVKIAKPKLYHWLLTNW